MSSESEMPKYQCHKQVWALKIADVDIVSAFDPEDRDKPQPITGAFLTPQDAAYAPFTVGAEYVSKHNPQPGGYYVRYEDGYESYSPAETFDSGYTRI